MSGRILSLLALLALMPIGLSAQTPEERIDAARARAGRAGIPVSLLESKIAEGRAKGVSMERIATAVEQRAAGLARAQAVMARGGARPSAPELAAGADALGSGVSEAVLRTISETAPGDRRAVAITALTELVALGQAPEEALQRVTEALQRGPEALANLPAQAGASGRGGPPAGVGGGRPENVGPPATVGPDGGRQPGPPAAIPAPGQRPGGGRPSGVGRPSGS